MAAKMLTMTDRLLISALLACLVFASSESTRAADKAGKPEKQVNAAKLFYTKVKPLLQAKCLGCHGDDEKKIKAKLDMRAREAVIKGGETGAALVPGHASKSLLYSAVTWRDEDLQMPPKERNRLTAAEVELIRQWIDAGAPWPEKPDAKWTNDDPDAIAIKTSGGLSPGWTNRKYKPEDLWAYYPAKHYDVPWKAIATDATAKTHNLIDAFIMRKLNAAGFSPAPRADKRTLIRRVTFDLIGLPPTPAEVDAFIRDGSGHAFEKLVDRLLASPRYGERMAQHWLDVARYADTAGFSNDYDRPHAWRYRDYVVRAFNNDKPFDQFVMEQIAGDEMFVAGKKRPELLMAAGYLRMGPWEHTGMSVAAVTRQQYLDDVTESVGRTFLATGMSCFKCHDHKFDPLPTRDYYRMQSVFAPIEFQDRKLQWMKVENTKAVKPFADRIRALQKNMGITTIYPKGATEEQRKESDLGVKKVMKKRGHIFQRLVKADQPLAFTVRSNSEQKIQILTGGSIESPTETVRSGILSAMIQDGKLADTLVPETQGNRRVALAKWIASRENPRTARVIVNRLWQMHFGRGLVESANDFGVMGKKPTHPELLDSLALQLVDDGWSLKKMHKRMLMSQAYQRSTNHSERSQIQAKDPTNALLAYFSPRRLTAEELRDSMLAISGELNLEMGGLPARPEINLEVAMQPRHIMGSVGPAYQPNRTPAERHRRTIYAQRIRTLIDPMLEVFNKPGPDVSCERRDQSNVTPQVFALFNGQNTYDRALAMAKRLEGQATSVEQRIDAAFQLAFGRTPTDAERNRCVKHVADMTVHHKANASVRVNPPKFISRTMVEEMTGLNFSWREEMDIYRNYVSDFKAWEAKPATRALADVCLVLMNSNEFSYLY